MKKLITILLLVLLAGQASGLLHFKTHEISFLQEADEKQEKSSEVKNEKEFLSFDSLSYPELIIDRLFGLYSFNYFIPPILEQLKPPPDVKL